MTKLEFKLKDFGNIDFAIFDFDGTIYPNLFLFDLAKVFFTVNEDDKKLNYLNKIALNYKSNNFKLAYTEFIYLLKDENKDEILNISNELIKCSYKYAKLTIKKLKNKYNIDSYLISITADFVAELAKSYFNFKDVFSINYLTSKQTGNFLGITNDIIDNPQKMKNRMFYKLVNKKKPSYIHFFDSIDDLLISLNASVKIGINPKNNLSKILKFDLILDESPDPWKSFYNSI